MNATGPFSRKHLSGRVANTIFSHSQLANWSDEDDDPATISKKSRVSNKWDNYVTLKHMFTLQKLAVRYIYLFASRESSFPNHSVGGSFRHHGHQRRDSRTG